MGLYGHALNKTHPFILFTTNLIHAGSTFRKLEDTPEEGVLPRLSSAPCPLWKRFRSQLGPWHPRLRYAIRLALSFVAGFAISELFEIDKGNGLF